METRKVDLGGGWQATIRRPGIYWVTVIADKHKAIARQYGEMPAESLEIKEQGKEEPASDLPDKITLHPEHYRFWEDELLPASLVEMHKDGQLVQTPALADLGLARFGKLLDAVMTLINEAEEHPKSADDPGTRQRNRVAGHAAREKARA